MWNDFLKSGTVFGLENHHLLLGWGERTWLVKPDTSDKPCFYVPDFFLNQEKKWFTHEQWKVIVANEYQPVCSPSFVWSQPSKEDFFESFNELQTLFQTSELKKAVPYVFLKSQEKMTRERLDVSLQHLIGASLKQSLHLYGFWDENHGILGATPEMLFQYSDHHLKTVACAGTQQDENFGGKEQEEHELVIEGIKAALAPFGKLTVGTTQIKKLNFFSHLFTPMKLTTHQFDFGAIVKAMHPTPALGTFPSGWDWLKEYEKKIPRERFGAPFGCTYQNRAYCYVAIRNVQWNSLGMTIGAGCGVTSQSDREEEWKEIQWKLQSIQKMLCL